MASSGKHGGRPMTKAAWFPFLALATLLTCVIAVLGWFNARRAATAPALERELARARGLGLPMKFAEVWPRQGDPARNAAPIYQKLAKPKVPFAKAGEAALGTFAPRTPAERRALDAALAPVKTDLDEFERGAKLPDCDFGRTPSPFMAFREYPMMKRGVKLLASRARKEAAAGDPERAMRTLRSAARVSSQISHEQILLSKLLQMSFQAITLRAAQDVLSDHASSPKVRALAREVLSDLGPAVDMKECLRGEWAYQRGTFEELGASKITYPQLLRGAGMKSGGKTPAEEALLKRKMRTQAGRDELEANAARIFLDFYEAMPDNAMNVTESRAAVKTLSDALSKGGAEVGMARIVIPPFVLPVDAAARSKTQRVLFEALLDALDAPTPPKSLPLTEPDAIDPFSGKPYRYEASAKSIRIWSVGANGKDDGGTNVKGKDIAVLWPYPRPSKP
ncbi:hypothetical protein EON81_16865 [bacterium]|nr:MAG: hypothetical protein EON81_16865 [bacterium]